MGAQVNKDEFTSVIRRQLPKERRLSRKIADVLSKLPSDALVVVRSAQETRYQKTSLENLREFELFTGPIVAVGSVQPSTIGETLHERYQIGFYVLQPSGHARFEYGNYHEIEEIRNARDLDTVLYSKEK